LNRGLAFVLAVTLATGAEGQERLDGRWTGYWVRAGDSMSVTLDIAATAAGGFAGTFGADRLRASGIPFSEARLDGCCMVTLMVRGDRTTMTFTGTLRGDSLSGTFREQPGDPGSFGFHRAPAEPAPFEEHDVSFANGAVTLAGTVLLPRGGRTVPGVVFLHGSGPEGRWGSRYLAAQLASHGVAAFIYDKRGVGGSSGDWRQATLDDLATDAAAAVRQLASEPRVDARRVGIHGHSQGGTLAPLVAVRAAGVAFVVGSAASGIPTDSTELYSVLNSVYPEAATARDSADARDYVWELVDAAYHGAPHFRLDSLAEVFRGRPWFFSPPPPDAAYWKFSPVFAQFRPLDWWSRVHVPVLLVYGAADQRVPPTASAERIGAVLRRAGNSDVTVRMFPGADHTFRLRAGPGGWPMTAPGYVDSLVDWLQRR
jgi:uncharacterized protein